MKTPAIPFLIRHSIRAPKSSSPKAAPANQPARKSYIVNRKCCSPTQSKSVQPSPTITIAQRRQVQPTRNAEFEDPLDCGGRAQRRHRFSLHHVFSNHIAPRPHHVFMKLVLCSLRSLWPTFLFKNSDDSAKTQPSAPRRSAAKAGSTQSKSVQVSPSQSKSVQVSPT